MPRVNRCVHLGGVCPGEARGGGTASVSPSPEDAIPHIIVGCLNTAKMKRNLLASVVGRRHGVRFSGGLSGFPPSVILADISIPKPLVVYNI